MRNLKRVLSLALALVMMLGMMIVGASAASADFDDAAEIDYTEAVDVLTGLGVLEGDDKGNFNPTDILTRAQAAKIICYTIMGPANAEKLGPNTTIFKDVPATHWAAGYISYCTNLGILAGYGDGTFGPEDELTGVAFGKLLLVAAGYDAEAQGYVGDNWALNIGTDMIANGLDIKGVVMSDPLTREQAAQMCLQALEMDTVTYTKGTVVGLIGPYVVENGTTRNPEKNNYATDGTGKNTQQFCEKYFPKLTKVDGGYAEWNRPIDHTWVYNKEDIAVVTIDPELTYTTKVTECDIADDLGLKKDAGLTLVTLNGVVKYADNPATEAVDQKIELTSKYAYGAQGQLTEVYKVGNTYEIVMIDTYLAKVTDVTEAEYDKNGHMEAPYNLYLTVYTAGDGVHDEKIVLESKTEWEYEKGDMLLINAYNDKDYVLAAGVDEIAVEASKYDEGELNVAAYAEIVGIADSFEGAQSAETTKNSHIINDVEYPDAVQFHKDEAVNMTVDYTWYLDQYENLIGSSVIATKYSYGVISAIKWVENGANLEDGYALATITYMDGTSETAKVAKVGTTTLSSNNVEETKQDNVATWVNQALYKISSSKKGLVLEETTPLSAAASIETGVPEIDTDVFAGKSTLFLIWNADEKEYETYTGIANVPTYLTKADAYWAADLENNTFAEYVFVIDPDAASDYEEVTFFAKPGAKLVVKSNKVDNKIVSYTITGGYVNGELADVTVKAANAAYKDIIVANQGVMMTLELVDGYVDAVAKFDNDAVELVTTTPDTLGNTKTYVVYGGSAVGAKLNPDTSVLTIGGNGYYISEDTKVISYSGKSLQNAVTYDADANLYIVYSMGTKDTKIAQYVVITNVDQTTVTFVDEDGTTVLGTTVVLKGEDATVIDDPTKPEDETNTYAFAGWDDADDLKAVTGDVTVKVTYTATPKAAKYTVTFDYEGVEAQEVVDGETATEPTAPTKTGYTFAGWKLGSDAYDFTTPVTADITLTATWTANPATISIEGTGVIADSAIATVFDAEDVEVVLATYIDDGYTFAYVASVDGAEYTFDGAKVTLTKITGDVTINVVTTPNTYTVKFGSTAAYTATGIVSPLTVESAPITVTVTANATGTAANGKKIYVNNVATGITLDGGAAAVTEVRNQISCATEDIYNSLVALYGKPYNAATGGTERDWVNASTKYYFVTTQASDAVAASATITIDMADYVANVNITVK